MDTDLFSTAHYDTVLSVADRTLTIAMVTLSTSLETIFVAFIAGRILWTLITAAGTGTMLLPLLAQRAVPVVVLGMVSVNWPTLCASLGKSLAAIGGWAAVAADGGDAYPIVNIFHASDVLINGFRIAGAIMKYAMGMCQGWYSCMSVYWIVSWFWLAALAVIVSQLVMAMVLVVAIIEFKLVCLLALMLLPSVSTPHTAWIAEGGIQGVIRYSVKLAILSCIVNLTRPLMTNGMALDNADGWATVQAAAMVAGSAWLQLAIVFGADRVARTVLSGSPHLGGHRGIVGAAMALGRLAGLAIGGTGPAGAAGALAATAAGRGGSLPPSSPGGAAGMAGAARPPMPPQGPPSSMAGIRSTGGPRPLAPPGGGGAAAVPGAGTPAAAIEAARSADIVAAIDKAAAAAPPGDAFMNRVNAGIIKANAAATRRAADAAAGKPLPDLTNRAYWNRVTPAGGGG